VAFAPVVPIDHYPPERIGADTWLIHQVQRALDASLCVYLNSMVITGSEPMIVDTGSVANRSQWLDDVFAIVDPVDVAWVFLSHDDADHTGNLAEVLARCPNARLVCSWALVERFTNAFDFPLPRCRWVNDGDRFDAGDRHFQAARPPVYDSPTTRGLLDERTGIYWAVDAFATPMPQSPVATVADLDSAFWQDAHAMFAHHGLSPWLGLVDQHRFTADVLRVQSLGMKVIASAHSPLIVETSIEAAFQILADLPKTPVPPCPDQATLDMILSLAPA